MLTLALACASVETPGTTPDPDPVVDVPEDEPSAERWFEPSGFFVAGTFAVDGDRVVPWKRWDIEEHPHLVVTVEDQDFFDPPVTCAVTLTWGEARLETWEVPGFWIDTFGMHPTTVTQRGFVGDPDITSDCPAIDPEVWGTGSVAELVGQWQWGLGFGEGLPRILGDVPPESAGGSIYADFLGGDFPADPEAWSTANAVDEEGTLVLDIYGRTQPLLADEILGTTRAQIHVESVVEYSAEMLRDF